MDNNTSLETLDAEREAQLRDFAARLAVTLHSPLRFDRALTHASCVAETGSVSGDYESLEFLGDAVLGLAVAHHLFIHVPDRTPGEYSRMRASMVNRQSVARVANALDIAPMIRLGRGEELSGGRRRTALIADCMEALIGAIYLDSGWDTAQEFVTRVFHDEFLSARCDDTVWDYKSRLQNYCQAERLGLPQFEVIFSEGPDHRKEFEVEVRLRGVPVGHGRGHSKKEAEQNAARLALEHENVMPQ